MAGRYPEELSPTEAALLAFLAMGEKSGYDLARCFEQSIDVMWAPAKAHMYVILPRLVEQGWATSREVVQDKRPNKQVYRITRKGRGALQRWLASPPEAQPERNLLLVKLFFGDLTDKEVMLEHVRRRREEALAIEEHMLTLQESVDEQGEPEPLYPWLTRRYALIWAEATVRWADEAEQAITRARARPGRPLLRTKRASVL